MRAKIIHAEPKPGDLIEISLIGSSHWALYVGDGYVIHLAPPGENSEAGAPTSLGVVKRQLLEEVVGNCSYEVNNHLDHLYKPRPIEEMLGSGKEMLGMEMEYSDLSRNCEHFVTDLRYGKARSRQVRPFCIFLSPCAGAGRAECEVVGVGAMHSQGKHMME
uniref:LRAT domain-containing protein n=1 Tax=Myotis lucifugus TaxID=59463 RepID=G1PY01_MYOLU